MAFMPLEGRGLGWGWVNMEMVSKKQPIPLLTSSLKGEEQWCNFLTGHYRVQLPFPG